MYQERYQDANRTDQMADVAQNLPIHKKVQFKIFSLKNKIHPQTIQN